jgi:tetratricopeptide (TPR) repeat protein
MLSLPLTTLHRQTRNAIVLKTSGLYPESRISRPRNAASLPSQHRPIDPLTADLADLATPLELLQAEMAEQEAKVKAVRQKLGDFSGWLLVFDNAGGPDDISHYLPQGSGGHVIITSRNDIWQRIANKVSIKTFSRDESIKFLFKRTGQQDKASAHRLAEELGDLPLALEQVGAYIEETGRTLSSYVELFCTHCRDLLKSQLALNDYPATVATTWDLSVQQVGKESPDAVSLLNLFCFLSPDGIPHMLLAGKNDRLPKPIAQALADPLRMDKAIACLRRYSLIELSGDGLFVHRLVQAIIRDCLTAEQKKIYYNAAVELVAAAFPSDTTDPQSWPLCERVAPNALTIWEHARALHTIDDRLANLLNNLGVYFLRIAKFQNAKPLLEQALEICRRVLGQEHPNTVQGLNNLGALLRAMGDYTAARPYCEQALEICRRVIGQAHPDTATSLNNLGALLQAMGNYTAAQPYYEEAREICHKVLGEMHPNTATSLNNLGTLMQAMGNYASARAYYEQALEIRRRVLGEAHPDTATSLNNLAMLCYYEKKLEEAAALMNQAVMILEKTLGAQHPDTKASRDSLAAIKRKAWPK